MESKEKFLSFNLGTTDTAVISLQNITEVLQVSLSEICAVPQLPNSVLGIYNWRGEMLWLVDLEEMLGYTALSKNLKNISRMMAIILENDGQYMGLLVRQLMDIEWLDITEMKEPYPELFSAKLSSFLQGYFINKSEEILFNLDALKIIDARMWKTHN